MPDPKPRRRIRALTKAQRAAAYDWPISTRCVVCGDAWPHRSHVVPRSQGGDDVRSNIVPLCGLDHVVLDQGAGDRRAIVAAAVRAWIDSEPDVLAYVLERKGQAWLERRYPTRPPAR
jgi:5-methylcytosine-specific restriction endonuclease McrA